MRGSCAWVGRGPRAVVCRNERTIMSCSAINALLGATAWQRAVHAALAPDHRQRRKSGCSFDVRQARACLAVGQADQDPDDPPIGLLSRIEAHRDRAPRSGCRRRCTRELPFGLLAPAASKPISRIGAVYSAPSILRRVSARQATASASTSSAEAVSPALAASRPICTSRRNQES